MEDKQLKKFLTEVLDHMPSAWLNLTTHRLDIYDESLAKTQFLEQFEKLYLEKNHSALTLNELPTAFDYIRLGHPLSCVMEWAIAQMNGLKADQVINFSSKTIPVLAVLRKNLIDKKKTQIVHTGDLPSCFDAAIIKDIYAYNFETKQVNHISEIEKFDGTTIFIKDQNDVCQFDLSNQHVDFFINTHFELGSILVVKGTNNDKYISAIQHVRRRETISMTPANSLIALNSLLGKSTKAINLEQLAQNKRSVEKSIQEITCSDSKPLIASSGLSIQYAIMMGLIHDGMERHPGKAIKIIVPPNCYGGTNDQARRVAACIENVEVMDLPVDGGNDMVKSVDLVLNQIAQEDALPYIIAEIPTNPRVEVPNLDELRNVLSQQRETKNGTIAIDPVFILDQTFCPNVNFLGENAILSSVRTISYASGSKFPSGGLCTAGYCISNHKADALTEKIELHLQLCDNEATALQYELLAKQLPSMLQRIKDAYINTRSFVNYIQEVLPSAKINFVSEELADQGFTPSVFSLDLPTIGNTDEERETYKRDLNLKLINLMINEIPNESKYCVSYGQLKGCYWTIPATSTQGTTKEGDKDYIARVALSANMDLDLHKKVFKDFVAQL